MKRVVPALWALCLLLAAQVHLSAAPIILVKDAGGHITPTAIELTLTTVPGCDEAKQIPENSRLVSDRWTLVRDDQGVGFFNGTVRIVGPDGVALFAGVLHGTVGLAAPSSDECKAPGHLEGMLNGLVTATTPVSTTPVPNSLATTRQPVEIRFVADEIPQSAGLVPLYKGRLSGLIALTPPPSPSVTVTSARLEYRTTDPIVAVVANGSPTAIRTWDGQSYCTIVRVEKQTDAGWKPLFDCPLERPSMPVDLKPGETRTVPLPPAGGDPTKEPGTYRLSLQYAPLTTDPATGNPVAGDPVVVTSEPFRVVAPPIGNVEVGVGKDLFAPDEPIPAVIANGLDRAILANAFYSYCTVLQLQRLTPDGRWVVSAMCMLTGGPTITIKPMEKLPVLLPPNATTPARKEPGVYRLALPYQIEGVATLVPLVAYSRQFQVGTPPPPPPGLRLAPDKLAYTAIDPITAILANGSAPVRIFDEQSYCTIVQLYRLEADQWALVAPCPLDRVPIPTDLQPGEVKKVTLAQNAPWPAGRYKLAVTFQPIASDGTVGDPVTVSTEPFPVGATPPPGRVLLAPSQRSYGVDGRITGIVKNGLPTPIVAWDMKSYCTILTLQKQDGDAWKDVYGCPLMRMPIAVPIGPGMAMPVELPPAPAPVKNEPGVYRLALEYGVPNSAGVPGDMTTVYSPTFSVVASATVIRPIGPYRSLTR